MTQIFPSKLVGATKNFPFDFTANQVNITSASVSATVYSGLDPSPQSIVNGPAVVDLYTVTQSISGGIPGTIYYLVCTAETSDGQTLTEDAFLAVLAGSA